MFSRKLGLAVVAVTFGVVGCASVPSDTDMMPAGFQVNGVAAMPKRVATAQEDAAVLQTLKEASLVPVSVEVRNVQVASSGTDKTVFCGEGRGNDNHGRMMPWATMVGQLNQDAGQVAVSNVKVGNGVAALCRKLGFEG